MLDVSQSLSIFDQWRFIAPERFYLAAFALIISLIGGFLTRGNRISLLPLFWRLIDLSFGQLGEKLDRTQRNEHERVFRGFFIAVILVLFAGALGLWIERHIIDLPVHTLAEILLITTCLSGGAALGLASRLPKVVKGQEKSDGAYLLLARASRVDLSARDDFTMTRTAAELLVRLYDKAMTAPLLWYILAGLPGLLIYSALAAYVWRNGYDGTWAGTGAVAGALDRLMGFVPSVFAASLLAMSTLVVPGSNAFSGLKILMGKSQSYDYEQGGAPLGVLAFTLGMTLGGPVTHLNGRVMRRKWFGPEGASAQLGADHLKRVVYMLAISHIYLLGAIFGAAFYAGLMNSG